MKPFDAESVVSTYGKDCIVSAVPEKLYGGIEKVESEETSKTVCRVYGCK